MLEVTGNNARAWSRLGSRGVFGQAMLSIGDRCENLMVLSADLGNSSGLDRFKATFPEKFLNTGIAEQNMIGIAAGLAKEGYNVFATSFAPFIAMRASEQIRMNLGYMNLNVKAVAIGSGISMGFLGNSHYGLEDASVMRSIPNMTVVCPADCSEIVKTVNTAAYYDGPMYIRLTGGPSNPIVYSEEYDFRVGKAIQLRAGSDISIFANGTMVSESLAAAELLEKHRLSVSVYDMHTLKPLDTGAIDAAIESTKVLVTVEEHSIIGGLGTAVAEAMAAKKNRPAHLFIGLPDEFIHAAEYRYMLERHGLTGAGIADTINRFIEEL